MNAVVFWFDLHLDEEESLTSAPRGIGKGGVVEGELKREDTATVQVRPGPSLQNYRTPRAQRTFPIIHLRQHGIQVHMKHTTCLLHVHVHRPAGCFDAYDDLLGVWTCVWT